MEKEKLREQCIDLFLNGKNYSEIAKLTGWSRTYITNLIKNDERIIKHKNTKKIKVCKRKSNNQMRIYVPTEFIEKIGISTDKNKSEYVNVSFDNDKKNIVIEKYK